MEYWDNLDVINDKCFFATDVKGNNYRLPYIKKKTYVLRNDT